LAVGALSALVSYTAIQIRATTRLDDSLDVFSCHGLAGMAGAMLTGVFATKLANPAGGDGWLAGNFAQMGIQLVAVLATVVLAATGTAVIMLIVKATVGVKADVRAQLRGLDLSEHGEEAYFGERGSGYGHHRTATRHRLGEREPERLHRAGVDHARGGVVRRRQLDRRQEPQQAGVEPEPRRLVADQPGEPALATHQERRPLR